MATREQRLEEVLRNLLRNFPDKKWLDTEVEVQGLKHRRFVTSEHLTTVRKAHDVLDEN